MKTPKRDEEGARKYFADEKAKFIGLLKHVLTIGNAVGNRSADPLRVIASWLYVRICVTGKSVESLLDPHETGYGPIRYLDHAGIAILNRALIENAAVLLYMCDLKISEDEWNCRRVLVDVHDFINRSQFLLKIDPTTSVDFPPDVLARLRKRLEDNAFFQTLPARRRQRLLDGEDMFVSGRHEAMLQLGWGDDFTRGMYKYLSNQAHSLSMSFHRTAENELYKNDSAGAQVVAAFSLTFARRALGAAALHMLELFQEIELGFDQIVIAAIKKEYSVR